jgi:hypothetical protein
MEVIIGSHIYDDSFERINKAKAEFLSLIPTTRLHSLTHGHKSSDLTFILNAPVVNSHFACFSLPVPFMQYLSSTYSHTQ